jgi:predicted lipid-binding transport protein (Tim44 family)
MNLTGNQRATIAGAVLLAGGLGAGVGSVIRRHIPLALIATVLALTGLTVLALALVRTWIKDASDERRELAEARQDANEAKDKYFALRAGLEGEATRIYRDLNSERARIATTLTVERNAMRAVFEERRLEEIKDAFQTGVEMERSGALRPAAPAPTPANLIQFPKPASAAEPQPEHSREHEGVAP